MTIPNHVFSIGSITPQFRYEAGVRVDVTAKNLPVLKGLALSLLTLHPGGIREPHWHPNADELSYCLSGSAKMTIFGPGSHHETFIIEAGEIAFVPRGYIHHIENLGSSPLQMIICFDDENPQDINLSSGVSVMPAHIMAATFKVNPLLFEKLEKGSQPTFICKSQKIGETSLAMATNRYKFTIEAVNPQVENSGGWVKMSNGFLMPALEGLACYSLSLNPKGAREPHWHPNAAELNYLFQGNARITLLSPEGKTETFDMKPGDLSFMPRGYLHHIENIGGEVARFAIFFNNVAPSDIGISGCLGGYSNEVLASIFDVDAHYFDSLPKYQNDLLIVGGG